MANETCATQDGDRRILIPRGSKPGATGVGAAAAHTPNRSTRQLYTLATAPKDLRRRSQGEFLNCQEFINVRGFDWGSKGETHDNRFVGTYQGGRRVGCTGMVTYPLDEIPHRPVVGVLSGHEYLAWRKQFPAHKRGFPQARTFRKGDLAPRTGWSGKMLAAWLASLQDRMRGAIAIVLRRPRDEWQNAARLQEIG